MTPEAVSSAGPAPVALESPGLIAGRGEGTAFELKFQLTLAEAANVEAWARRHLTPDAHGIGGAYRITTVYCDTPRLDVYHRARGYRRSKHRLRRYGDAGTVYLERKTKWSDRVRKRRSGIPLAELSLCASNGEACDWTGGWFLQRTRFLELRPTSRVAYDRTAFVGHTPDGAVRLTIDRNLIGVPASGWEVQPLAEGPSLLPGEALLELKFHDGLPRLFKDLLSLWPLPPARVSKYRLCVGAWGLDGEKR
jgi:hypothetical protein